MKCNTCGRQSQSEAANFCEYCGSSFREHSHAISNMAQQEQRYGDVTSSMTGTSATQISSTMIGQKPLETKETEKPISFLSWLSMYGLLFIPFIGWIIFVVQLFVLSFTETTPESKKNWARATLIYVAVTIVITIFLIILYVMMIIRTPMYQDMMNGTFDYNSLYQNVK